LTVEVLIAVKMPKSEGLLSKSQSPVSMKSNVLRK